MTNLEHKPGDRIAEYVLLEKIGASTLGEVWKARLADAPYTVVALKIASDPERFRDARSMGTQSLGLEHAAVVRTLKLDVAHDPPYAAMEWVEGRSLRQVMASGRRLTVEDALETAAQVLDVLAYAHGRGVIHGNLKPENVLFENLAGAAGTYRVRVTDFGPGMVARTGASPAGAGSAYLAPEQRQGEMLGVPADLYAVGVMLFETLTGRLPSGAEAVSDAGEGVPVMLDGPVGKALHLQPARRYAGASEMRRDVLACTAAVRAAKAEAGRSGAGAGAQAAGGSAAGSTGASGAQSAGAGCGAGPAFQDHVRKVVDDVKGKESVDLGRAFNDSLGVLSRNAGTLLLAGLLSGLLSFASAFILAGPLTCGMYAMLLRVLRQRKDVEIGDLFGSFDRFWSKMIAFYVLLIGILIGLAHVVVPGIVVAALTMYVFPILAERKVGFGEALSESAGAVWKHGLLMHAVLITIVMMMDVAAGTMLPGGILASWLLTPFLSGLVASAWIQVQEKEVPGPQTKDCGAPVPAMA